MQARENNDDANHKVSPRSDCSNEIYSKIQIDESLQYQNLAMKECRISIQISSQLWKAFLGPLYLYYICDLRRNVCSLHLSCYVQNITVVQVFSHPRNIVFLPDSHGGQQYRKTCKASALRGSKYIPQSFLPWVCSKALPGHPENVISTPEDCLWPMSGFENNLEIKQVLDVPLYYQAFTYSSFSDYLRIFISACLHPACCLERSQFNTSSALQTGRKFKAPLKPSSQRCKLD